MNPTHHPHVAAPGLHASFLDKLIHPLRDPNGRDSRSEDHDPGRPFTPPPSQPSKQEEEDDDQSGPNFPMNPAVA